MNYSHTSHDDEASPFISGTDDTRTVEIDWQIYAKQLDDSQLNEAQKEEFISALWSILIFLWGAGYSTKTTKIEVRVD